MIRPAASRLAPPSGTRLRASGILATALSPLLACAAAACSPTPPVDGPRPDVSALFAPPTATPREPTTEPTSQPTTEPLDPDPAADTACRSDDDCRYDPSGRRCGTSPAFNKQPPLVDQGIVCHCEAARCSLLRVDPVPCEGDASCAVSLSPRPHPVRASAEHPYRKPAACQKARKGAPRKVLHHVTCERTNICTMHTRECEAP